MDTARSDSKSWRGKGTMSTIIGVVFFLSAWPVYAQDASSGPDDATSGVETSGHDRPTPPDSYPGKELIDDADNIVDVKLFTCDHLDDSPVRGEIELSDEEVAALRREIEDSNHHVGTPITPYAWDITLVFELKSGQSFSAVPVADGLLVDSCEPCTLDRADANGNPDPYMSFLIPEAIDTQYWEILESHLGHASKAYGTPIPEGLLDGLD